VLLIEEPEAYVSPRSQIALMNIVAEFSVKQGVSVVMTTHAPWILEAVPTANTRLLVRQGENCQVIQRPSGEHLNKALGIATALDGIVLVEDKTGRHFARSIVLSLAPHIMPGLEFQISGSESDVSKALHTFPRAAGRLSVVGLLDGDSRARERELFPLVDGRVKSNWPYCFLPGAMRPEAGLRSTARTSPTDVARRLGVDEGFFLASMTGVQGENDHDWLDGLVQALGLSHELIVSGITAIWLRDETNRRQAETLMTELLAAISQETPA
jgi:hypothetical protein